MCKFFFGQTSIPSPPLPFVNSIHCDNYYDDNVSMNDITDPVENDVFSSQDLIIYDPEHKIEIR